MGTSDLLAWVHAFVHTHPDREARDATCFAFIVCSKLHKLDFCSTLITAKFTKKSLLCSVYFHVSICFFPAKEKFQV